MIKPEDSRGQLSPAAQNELIEAFNRERGRNVRLLRKLQFAKAQRDLARAALKRIFKIVNGAKPC